MILTKMILVVLEKDLSKMTFWSKFVLMNDAEIVKKERMVGQTVIKQKVTKLD